MFQPGRDTVLTIKQLFGITAGRLADAIHQYRCSATEPHNDRDFLLFCKTLSGRQLQLPRLAKNWKPTVIEVDDIPTHILTTEYFELFIQKYNDKPLLNGDFDSVYTEFCRMRWAVDSRNPYATGPTFMTMDWEPDAELMDQLKSIYRHEYHLILGEFKLYWIEAGAYRKDWSAALRAHTQNGFTPADSHN